MTFITILIGKLVQTLSRLRGTNGSAAPGLVVERLNPKFLNKILQKLPHGVIVISGTNGKTTTTKIITELLRAENLRVFTNNTGSNFVRGVISAVLDKISLTGKFDYDLAVLELDEAHAVKFCAAVPIDYALLLNVQRDQLDRFGEIDHTADLLNTVAGQAKKAVVLNREDPRIAKIHVKHAVFFGLSDTLKETFPSDDNLLTAPAQTSTRSTHTKHPINNPQAPALTLLESLSDKRASFKINQKHYSTALKLTGIYNAFNATGALALCLTVFPNLAPANLIKTLSNIEGAFGRGETFTYNGATIELFLVKNPSAFQLSLASFADNEHDYMIAINDLIADGRDVSWLWNVDFSALPKEIAATSGIRATDIALRLKYDEKTVKTIEPDLTLALKALCKNPETPKRIFATYTAMLELRKIITGKSIL
ncbi:DUF1727 domain-containing protein [Candidatus Saccharibacteria bacterium]|nr:DUF1727 domain-containing protein [Candidatus Saccharibacteria bacterium]